MIYYFNIWELFFKNKNDLGYLLLCINLYYRAKNVIVFQDLSNKIVFQ